MAHWGRPGDPRWRAPRNELNRRPPCRSTARISLPGDTPFDGYQVRWLAERGPRLSTLIVGGGCTSGHDDARAVWWAAPTRRGVGTRTKPGAYAVDSTAACWPP